MLFIFRNNVHSTSRQSPQNRTESAVFARTKTLSCCSNRVRDSPGGSGKKGKGEEKRATEAIRATSLFASSSLFPFSFWCSRLSRDPLRSLSVEPSATRPPRSLFLLATLSIAAPYPSESPLARARFQRDSLYPGDIPRHTSTLSRSPFKQTLSLRNRDQIDGLRIQLLLSLSPFSVRTPYLLVQSAT